MILSFHTINDDTYNFLLTGIDDERKKNGRLELKKLIRKAGRRKIVFVEGYDDKKIFEKVFPEHKGLISFIDVSLEESKQEDGVNISAIGGCEGVKILLSLCVSKIPQQKVFYGIIDRDLRKDDEIELEMSDPRYDGRLFIFKERYTIENYFVTLDILYEFVEGKSIQHKSLIKLLNLGKNNFEQKIIIPIEECLIDIGAGNLTIRYFNKAKSFLEDTIQLDQIEERIINRLGCNNISNDDILKKLEEFKLFINESKENIHKFASGKLYASYNFNLKIEEVCGVNLQINNHKDTLAGILKEKGLPNDFKELLKFLGCL
jgi:hypothetical protein